MNSGKPFKPKPLDDALFKVCSKGPLEEVRALLDQGADPTLPHWEEAWCDGLPEDYYCVHEAACNPDLRVFDLLVERGADPNQFEFYGRQPLAYAGRFNTIELIRKLVELGNDPSRYDVDGGSVLSWSATNPDLRVPAFLLEHGAEPGGTAYGDSELDEALQGGTPDHVRFFVRHGSDLEYVSPSSVEQASLENLRALLECGFNPNYPADEYEPDGKRLVDTLDPARRALFLEFGAKP